MNRRTFLRAGLWSTVAAPAAVACYGFAESNDVVIERHTVRVPRLPAAFDGTRAAFLSDIHLGPYLSADFVAIVARTVNALDPDVVLLGGDYSLREGKYIGPCFEVLAELRAPMGVHGVLGNHDYWHGVRETHDGFASARITELTNRGVTFEKRGDRFTITGVDDYWEGAPDLTAALRDVRPDGACVLLSHNPDYAERLTDRRVGLVLSGHTHGGQIVFPEVGAPWTPSRYGMKYARGLVEAPATRVYVSTGVGMSGVPMRLNCRPQIALLTFVA